MADERCEACGVTTKLLQAVDGRWWCALPSGCRRRKNQRDAIARAEAAGAVTARYAAFGRVAAGLLPVLKAVIAVGFESDTQLAATYIGDIDAALRLLEETQP